MATPPVRTQRKVIITCAVTGAIHTPTMSPHLPIAPEEIAESAVSAANAGAAIVHLHARSASDGRPTQDPEVFKRFLPQIKAASDVVVNLTTGGAQTMTVEERLRNPSWVSAEASDQVIGAPEPTPQRESGAGGRVLPRGEGGRRAEGPSAVDAEPKSRRGFDSW